EFRRVLFRSRILGCLRCSTSPLSFLSRFHYKTPGAVRFSAKRKKTHAVRLHLCSIAERKIQKRQTVFTTTPQRTLVWFYLQCKWLSFHKKFLKPYLYF